MCKTFFLSLFLFSFALEASVSLRLDRRNPSLGDVLNLSVTVEGSLDEDFNFPNMDFADIVGQGSSSSLVFDNGSMTKTQTYTYRLLMKKEGEHTIPSFTVSISGKVQKTEALKIKVSAASKSYHHKGKKRSRDEFEEDEENAQESELPDAFIRRDFSKKSVYVGEPFFSNVKFHFSLQVQNLQARPSKSNAFRYFSFDEESYQTNYRGSLYKVLALKKILLPIKSGSVKLDSFLLNAELLYEKQQTSRRPRSLFDDFFSGSRYSVKQKSFATDPETIEVLPIPQEGRPDDYEGLVGLFKVQATLSDQKLKAGETTTLTITIFGVGSLDGSKAPALELPDSIKVYADKPELKEEIDSEKGLLSKKIFKFALVPTKEGTYSLGEFKESYFDFQKGKFRLLKAGLGMIEVSPGASEVPGAMASSPVLVRKEKVSSLSADLIDIKRSLPAASLKTPQKFSSLFYLTLLLLLIYGSLILVPKLSFLSPQMTAKRRRALAYKAYKSQKSSAKSLEEINNLFKTYFADIFNLNASSLTVKELDQALEGFPVKATTRSEIIDIFTRLEKMSYGYSSGSMSESQKLLDQIHSLIKKVERHV